MKLFPIFFLLTNISAAQISLQENDFSSAGDTVRISNSVQVDYDPSQTGEGLTWDYSSLFANSQFLREFTSIGFSPVQFAFGILAPTPYQATYFIPENTIPLDQLNGFLPVELSDARSYLKSSQDSITRVGFSVKVSGVDVAFKSDTIETKYKFPIDYQQQFTTRGYTFIDLNPAADFKIKQHRSVNSEIDGFGQLILPFGTFQVLRLKREIYEIDSVYQTFFGTGEWFGAPPISTTEYEWLGENAKDVLLKIVVNNQNGVSQIQRIEYQDTYLGLDAGLEDHTSSVEIFPNPTSDEFTLISTKEVLSFRLVDPMGKILIQHKNSQSNTIKIDLSSYSTGIYTVILETIGSPRTFRVAKN
jgi:hypothetical protein